MLRVIKKVVLGSLSVLGISVLVWILVALNPNWVYAHQTHVDFVTIHHNSPIEEGTVEVVQSAIEILKKSDLYNEDIEIDLCLNDNSFYPKINPLVGKPLAYAMVDKTVLYNLEPKFKEGLAETQWEVNGFELRKFNLPRLLAHEFTHNLQYHDNPVYIIRSSPGRINWKLEGHAEYIAQEYKNKGDLKQRISKYLVQESKDQIGFPVFKLEDGTAQVLSYYKYAIIIQYMMEEEKLSYSQVCDDSRGVDEIYSSVLEWAKD